MLNWLTLAFMTTLAGAPASVGAPAERGVALYESHDYSAAIQAFEDLLSKNASDETALHYLGKISFDHSDLDRAQEYFEKLVELEPDNAQYQLELGNVYGWKARTSSFFMNKKKWAGRWKKKLELAVELDPRNLDARDWLATYLLNAPGFGGGDKERGLQISRETIPVDEVFGRLMLGYAYSRNNKLDLAEAEYNTVLELDPQEGRAHTGLGYLFMKQEDYEKAKTSFAIAIEIVPDDALAYEGMVYYQSKQGTKKEEASAQEATLKADPLHSDTRYDLARNYHKRKLQVEAIAHYKQLIALIPKHHKAGKAKKYLRKLKKQGR